MIPLLPLAAVLFIEREMIAKNLEVPPSQVFSDGQLYAIKVACDLKCYQSDLVNSVDFTQI